MPKTIYSVGEWVKIHDDNTNPFDRMKGRIVDLNWCGKKLFARLDFGKDVEIEFWPGKSQVFRQFDFQTNCLKKIEIK